MKKQIFGQIGIYNQVLIDTDFERLCTEVKNLTQFKDFNIKFDSQEIFAKRFIKKSKDNDVDILQGFWYLQTPLDLNPNKLLED